MLEDRTCFLSIMVLWFGTDFLYWTAGYKKILKSIFLIYLVFQGGCFGCCCFVVAWFGIFFNEDWI